MWIKIIILLAFIIEPMTAQINFEYTVKNYTIFFDVISEKDDRLGWKGETLDTLLIELNIEKKIIEERECINCNNVDHRNRKNGWWIQQEKLSSGFIVLKVTHYKKGKADGEENIFGQYSDRIVHHYKKGKLHGWTAYIQGDHAWLLYRYNNNKLKETVQQSPPFK